MDFPVARLNIVRDMFLFCCFTGLAFIDAKELKRTEIVKDNNGKMWIRKGRHKMKKEKARCISNVPLINPAIEILEKYEDHPICIEKDVCLPLFCNQTMNSYLKQIATLCNIDKNLTTHLARHSISSFSLKTNDLQNLNLRQVTI